MAYAYIFDCGAVITARSLNAARAALGRPSAVAVRCTLNGVDQWPKGFSVEPRA